MAELRPLKCEFGVLQRADGSARVLQGASSVLAAVYGPAEVKASKERCDRATVEVVVKPARGQGGVRERRLEQLLAGCCDGSVFTSLYPHTALSIVLQVITDHGTVLSTLCLAMCLALVDAGVPLSSPFSALSTAFLSDADPITDPTLAQEQASQCVVTVVTGCLSGHIISTCTQGVCSLEQLETSMAFAVEAGKSVAHFYHKAIQRRLSKDAKFSHLNIAF